MLSLGKDATNVDVLGSVRAVGGERCLETLSVDAGPLLAGDGIDHRDRLLTPWDQRQHVDLGVQAHVLRESERRCQSQAVVGPPGAFFRVGVPALVRQGQRVEGAECGAVVPIP